jgi:hypothetical protein
MSHPQKGHPLAQHQQENVCEYHGRSAALALTCKKSRSFIVFLVATQKWRLRCPNKQNKLQNYIASHVSYE